MSTIQKQKDKKSSEELIQEAKDADRKLVSIYVPLICQAIQEENPEFTLKEIQRNCVERCQKAELPWSALYIGQHWGEFARAYEKSGKYKGISAERKSSLRKKIFNTFDKIPQPKIIEPPEEKYTPVNDEELDKELHSMQLGKFGTTGKSIREIYGDITHYANGLFETLTQKEMPYADNVDLIVDYIKPSREYWRSLMLEFDEIKRTRTHNELSFLAELIEDRLQIISEVKDK
jgi:hypothetical protein